MKAPPLATTATSSSSLGLSRSESEGEAYSSQVNDPMRTELARRRLCLLDEMLDEYERTEGPPDEVLVAKYMDLLA